ncbi:SRPBCC family protein [Catenulispora yoronensis]|uniref:SRPBCC family protein n=1 Tax=Catenulispora yoronensis TaxID=450799 RepID=A0ABN2TJX5_9ACTN
MWEYEYSVEAEVEPRAVFGLWTDAENWHTWNDGVGAVEVHGPFAAGTEFTMTPPGQDTVTMLIADVTEDRGFTDVNIEFDDVVITTFHRIEDLGAGLTRVTYRTEITGDAADTVGAEVGPLICADFPDVVDALVARAAQLGATG